MTIETKYNINDVVFIMTDNGVTECSVKDMHVYIRKLLFNKDKSKVFELSVTYLVTDIATGKFFKYFDESKLFATKEDLINAI